MQLFSHQKLSLFRGRMLKAHTTLYVGAESKNILTATPFAYYQLRPLELDLLEDFFLWGLQTGISAPVGSLREGALS